MKTQNLDNYGRGIQTKSPRTLQLFVEVYQMVGEYPFQEVGKMVEKKWIQFSTFCTEPQDIDEELNVSNKEHSVSFNVLCIK